MNQILSLVAGALLLCPATVQAFGTANATLFCCSLRCQRGLDPGALYYLDITSDPAGINRELAPNFFDTPYTHSAYVSLIDESLGETLSGQLALDVPNSADLNRDGFDDFFQLDQGITNGVSTGAYHLDLYGNGSATATWNRPAGSKNGSCALTLRLLPFEPVTFEIPFEVLEYRGALSYTPGATNVSGTINLVQSGDPGNRMSGALLWTKSFEDPGNELILEAGNWSNQSQQVSAYTSSMFARDSRWPTNYCGFIEFADEQTPATLSPYSLWVLSIDDVNDSNGNQIPDLSDETGTTVEPRQPQLALRQRGTDLVFTIRGEVGRLHELQSAVDLAPEPWRNVAQFTLTNIQQEIELALPAETLRFWRIVAR